ncbi:MAG: lysylphosphatidylglycerol synthase transmembrane domain-containing protein [Candidatus Omnitrophota bacterium]
MKNLKDRVFAVVRIAVSFGLMGLLFWVMKDDIRGIWATIVKSNMVFIGFGVVLILINTALMGFRLQVIFRGENLYISLWEAVQLTYIGYYFNNFMPTAVGGDVVKAHYASNFTKKRIKSYASVLMDRFIGLYAFLIVAAIALVVDGGRFRIMAIRPTVFILVIVGIAGFIIATNRAVAGFMQRFFSRIKMLRIGEKLNALYDIVHDYRNRADVVVKAFVISIFAQCLYFYAVYIFFLSLDVRVSIGLIFLIMPIVTFISMIPSLGGLGVREGAIVAFFMSITGKETAFATSLLLLFGLFVISLIGGVIYFCWGFSSSEDKQEAQVE